MLTFREPNPSMVSRICHILRLIIMIVAFSSNINAQSFNPKNNFKHLNVQNGLVQNIVYHFLQDSRGYMWIGTHSGLTLYDGIRTINFLQNEHDSTSLSGKFITSLLEDSVQQIWVGNENGINAYNRAGNTFSHFAVDRPDGKKDTTYCVLLGFASANDLWFLDTKTKSIRSLNTKTRRTTFIADINTNNALFYNNAATQTIHIWSSYDIGTIHQIYKNNQLIRQQTFFTGKDVHPGDPALEVNHVFQQNDTTVWLSTSEGLVKLNPVLNKFSIFNKWKNQIVRNIRFATLSPKGILWAATGPQGVYTFDVTTNQFIENFRNDKLDPFSICSDNIVALYFDRMGNIWCGSYGNGCSYTNTENTFFANHISKNETQAWKGINNISWLGADHREIIWCVFADAPGFWVLDKKLKISLYRNPLLENGTNFSGSVYKILFDAGDDVWCITDKGLYRYNLHSNRMRPVKYELLNEEVLGSIWIHDIIRLHDGSIIFSTYAGLYRVTKESGQSVVRPFSILNKEGYIGFGRLFQDKENNIYVESLGNYLYILKPTSEGKEYDFLKTIYFTPVINQYFYDKDEKIIYLATSDGLYHINNKNFKIEKEGITNKLPSINVSSVFKKDYRLWVFGEKGLYVFDKKNNVGRTYTVEDGLPTNEFSLSALIYTSDNRCVAGTSNGLVSFFPDQKQDSIYPPRAQITGIYINDILNTSSKNPNETKKINLTYKENTFSFDFAPITFQHAGECGFEYKLEKYDETWIKSGAAHYTRYSKIPPGSYTFSLRVTDAMGRISPYTKTLEIEIARAFWQTTLFKIVALIFLFLIGWLFLKWYFSYKIRKQKGEFEKQQAIERERTRIATDMHDDLGAGLSRIKFLSQALMNKKTDDESMKTGLDKITGYADEMTENMGEIVWALNEKNDTLADLVAYTRSYTMEYLANHHISCEVNTPLHLPGNFIAGEIRRNIFLSVKECLHNIIKHADATQVYFSIQIQENLEIIIHDNGKGIDWNNRRAFSNGLQNIHQRMKEIKGKADFINEQGTKVLLHVPLQL